MRTVQKELLRRFRGIAEKHSVPEQQVIDIEASIWKYVRKEIESANRDDFNSFRNIRIKYFGSFLAHKGKHSNMEKRRKDND